jgi:hypothetical protein
MIFNLLSEIIVKIQRDGAKTFDPLSTQRPTEGVRHHRQISKKRLNGT